MQFKKKSIPWNKGKKNCYSEETIKRMSLSQKGKRGYWTGKKRGSPSIETRGKMSLAQTGKKLSKEHKEKLRKIHLGRKCTEETKRKISEGRQGEKHWNYGKHLSEKTKWKISKVQKGRKHKPQEGYQKGHKQFNSGRTHFKKGQVSGKNHPNWKGGITKLNHLIRELDEYKQWRSDVFQRDNWTCRTCKQKVRDIEAHHSKKKFITIIRENNITTIKEAINCRELWDIDNGITLCCECHRLTKKKK